MEQSWRVQSKKEKVKGTSSEKGNTNNGRNDNNNDDNKNLLYGEEDESRKINIDGPEDRIRGSSCFNNNNIHGYTSSIKKCSLSTSSSSNSNIGYGRPDHCVEGISRYNNHRHRRRSWRVKSIAETSASSSKGGNINKRNNSKD